MADVFYKLVAGGETDEDGGRQYRWLVSRPDCPSVESGWFMSENEAEVDVVRLFPGAVCLKRTFTDPKSLIKACEIYARARMDFTATWNGAEWTVTAKQ